MTTKTVDYFLERAEAELDAAEERIRSGTTGVIGVSGYPAYHANRANAYATMALAVARDAPARLAHPPCIECGKPSVLSLHDAYGPGKPGDYCTVCFISDYRIDTDRIPTSVLGMDAEVIVLLDSATCNSCGLLLAAPEAITNNSVPPGAEYWDGEKWVLAVEGRMTDNERRNALRELMAMFNLICLMAGGPPQEQS